jgi:hypothetical protein
MSPILNSKERERLDRLRERSEYLLRRITDKQTEGIDPWQLVAERSALVWAIDAIEALRAGTYQPPPVDRGPDNRVRPSALERWERRNGITPAVEVNS